MKTFGTLFVSGALGLVLFKLFFGLVAPLLAIVFGFFILMMKLAFFAAIAYFVYSLVRGRRRERDGTV